MPADRHAAPDATEQRLEARVGEHTAEDAARPTGTEGTHPEGLESAAERPPDSGVETPRAERAEAPGAAEPPRPVEPRGEPRSVAEGPGVDGAEVYGRVLREQLDKGSSPEVAEARAQVARSRAERGLRGGGDVPLEGAAPPTPEGSRAPVADADAVQSPAEDPDAAYERVLAEERAKGSSDAVALARAKAARVRAMKGTSGPS